MSETPESIEIPDEPFESSEDATPLFTITDAELPETSEPVPDHNASKTRKPPFLFKTDRPEKTPRTTKRKAIPKRKGQFVQPLTALYTSVGIMLMPFDAVCGKAVVTSAEDCARSLDELAYQNDAVRRVVYALVQTSTLGAVIAAHAPILMAVAIHHIPSVQNAMGSLGAQMAENIEAEMRAAQPPASGESE